MPEAPDLRAGDADRERLVARLREACAEGRITLDEFADRVDDVYRARTFGELERVTADLPVPAPAPVAARRAATHRVIAVFGGADRKGRWRIEGHVRATAFCGGVHLDLREAEIDAPEVVIRARAVMGGIEVVVPEGIEVEVSGPAIMGGRSVRIADVPRRPGTPVVRVKVFAFWGGVSVRSKPPRSRRPAGGAAARPRAGQPLASGVPDGTVTVVFTDIEGFTALTERLGDARAQAILREHNAIVRRAVAGHRGREIKAAGDSFMLAFSSAADALRCAVDVQRAIDERDLPVRVRVGIHTGEAIREDGDLFGRAVIVASRISDLACGGEVLASSLTVALAESTGEFTFDEGRDVELKGLTQRARVHALKWTP